MKTCFYASHLLANTLIHICDKQNLQKYLHVERFYVEQSMRRLYK